jgi:hypothetical protein
MMDIPEYMRKDFEEAKRVNDDIWDMFERIAGNTFTAALAMTMIKEAATRSCEQIEEHIDKNVPAGREAYEIFKRRVQKEVVAIEWDIERIV